MLLLPRTHQTFFFSPRWTLPSSVQMLTLHQALQTAVLWEQGFHSETCSPLRSVILHLKKQLKCHMLTEAFFLCLKKPRVLWRVLYKSKLWFLLLLYNIIIGYYCNRLSTSYPLPMCLYIRLPFRMPDTSRFFLAGAVRVPPLTL